MYNPKTLDPIHKEALDRATELLQAFMERQEKLRQWSKQTSEWNDERNNNALIITCIQWIRYFLWGNSPEVVEIKTKTLNRWIWNNTTGGPVIFPWAEDVLKIDTTELNQYGRMPYKKWLITYLTSLFQKELVGCLG